MRIVILLLFLLPYFDLNSQSLYIFDADASTFPVMKAKFYANDAENNQILHFNKTDLQVHENGIKRDILDISCGDFTNEVKLSSLLAIDISKSMGGDKSIIAKETAKSWINSLNLGSSECAITAFTTKNQYLQDFTTDKNKLLQKIENLPTSGTTDFNAAFINPYAGGLYVLKKAKYKKIMILITDGCAAGDEQQIINEAKSIGATIYCVTLKYKIPDILKNVAEATGGKWYEEVSTVEDARNIYLSILAQENSNNPCTLEWQSDYLCQTETIDIEISLYDALSQNITIEAPEQSKSNLLFNPVSVLFKDKPIGTKSDTVIKVTAIGSDFEVNNIATGDSRFTFRPNSFYIAENQTIDLTLSFIPTDSSYVFSKSILEASPCDKDFYSIGYYTKRMASPSNQNTIDLLHPNGGQIFLAGSDTVVTWNGVLPTDTIIVKLSTDNGKNWSLLTDDANNMSYEWKIDKNIESDKCLISVTNDLSKNEQIKSCEIEWEKSFGGSEDDQAYSIIQTDDGGFAVAGYTSSEDGDITQKKGYYDYWVIRLDNQGKILWEKTYGGSSADKSHCIIQTDDGGFAVAGYSNSSDKDISDEKGNDDYWIIKLNKDGVLEWEKSYGGKDIDHAYSISQTNDGGYVIAGESNSTDGDIFDNNGSFDYWIIKIDSQGSLIWEKTYGGSDWDQANSVIQTADGGYVVAGYTSSKNGDVSKLKGFVDYWILKLDSKGMLEWENTFGGSRYDIPKAIIQTDDNCLVIAGSVYSSDLDVSQYKGESDYWIIKIDNNGNLLWEKTLGGRGVDHANSIIQTSDKGFIVAGYSESKDKDVKDPIGERDYWISKLDKLGNLSWQKSFGGTNIDEANSIVQTIDGGFAVAGISFSSDYDLSLNHGRSDYWVIKLSPERNVLKSDTSNSVFSIVQPKLLSNDIDMGDGIINQTKDTLIVDFLENTGQWQCRVDSIYFIGPDASFFKFIGPFPEYTVPVNQSQIANITFTPTQVRDYSAKVVIETQAETLYYDITGSGVPPQIQIIDDFCDFGIHELFRQKDSLITPIKNISNDPVNIYKIEMMGPDHEQFIFLDSNQLTPFTLTPSTIHNLNLRFNPKYIGRTTGQIAIYFDGEGSPAITQLHGAGIGAEVTASNDSGYVNDVIGIKIFVAKDDIEKFADIVGSCEGIIRVERSILGALHKEDLVEVKGDSAYIRFKGEVSSNNNELAIIPLKVALGKVESSTIDFENIKWYDTSGNLLEYDTKFHSGFFKLQGLCEEGGKRFYNPDGIIRISNLSPNPAKDKLSIDLDLSEKGQTKLEIYNSLGKLAKLILDKNIQKTGKRIIKEDINELTNGVYTVILSTPTYRQTKNLIIIK